MVPEFRNEPLTNFADPANRRAYEAALAEIEKRLGADYPAIVGGTRITTAERIVSINPCQTDQVVGRVARADIALAEKAMQAACTAFETWRRFAPAERARVLFKAAALMRRRRHELSALVTLEIGKTWAEADAETAEAIDFLEYYGREMIRLGGPQPVTPLPGEENELIYIPLGVGIVIPPWNFPIAILTGMTAASIVAGNTVILKPSSLTPVIGYHVVEILEEAGLPAGVVNFLPGTGAEIGDYLVSHPQTRFITFTGSRDVGLHIAQLAARIQPGQRWIKRVIAEMGGKDAIVVDESADLADAARGIVTSAFGFQGQKCSACSRVIAHRAIADRLLADVVDLTKQLTLGPARQPETDVAAVADQNQFRKVMDYIKIGRTEGRLVVGGEAGPSNGYYIQPTIFANVPPSARLSCEEIFGPVVAFTPAPSFEEAIAYANATEYGLTGSVYARDRARLEYARREFHVGNLYFNRKCTGALVGVHPFGGFNMSGTDSKAGGPDYLLHYTQAKAIAERF